MNAAQLVSSTVSQAGWRCVHASPELTVVEIEEGLPDGRSQFVEISYIPGGVAHYGAGTLPALLQIRSRVFERSGAHYDHDSAEPLNTMAILSNDFQPFGIIRLHPHYYIACTTIIDGLTPTTLSDLILSAGAIGDQFERNLHGVDHDRF